MVRNSRIVSRSCVIFLCAAAAACQIATGATAILPHGGNLYQNKVPAAVFVLNGFGKSSGLSQVDELGEIEAPIVLTNTLSVAARKSWSTGCRSRHS